MFILLVTARADTADLQQALEAGANDYLTKPLDLGLLNVRISVAERQIRDLTERNQSRAALAGVRADDDEHSREHDGRVLCRRHGLELHLHESRSGSPARPQPGLGSSGRSFGRAFPDFAGSVFETNYRQVMAEKTPVSFEASDVSGRRWFEVHAYPSGGGVSVFFRDITERKRIEERTPHDEQTGVVRHARGRDRARLEQHSHRHLRQHRTRADRGAPRIATGCCRFWRRPARPRSKPLTSPVNCSRSRKAAPR